MRCGLIEGNKRKGREEGEKLFLMDARMFTISNAYNERRRLVIHILL